MLHTLCRMSSLSLLSHSSLDIGDWTGKDTVSALLGPNHCRCWADKTTVLVENLVQLGELINIMRLQLTRPLTTWGEGRPAPPALLSPTSLGLLTLNTGVNIMQELSMKMRCSELGNLLKNEHQNNCLDFSRGVGFITLRPLDSCFCFSFSLRLSA